jgi:hypothetical protein
MGSSYSWFASARDRAETIDGHWLVDTGEPVQPGHCELAGAELPGGGFLLLADSFWHEFIAPKGMEILSDSHGVVGCSESSGTNTSVAFCYVSGKLAWQVSHILDKGREHLDIEGPAAPATLKKHFADACRRARELSYDAVLEVPALLAQEVSGFLAGAPTTLPFTRLERMPRVNGERVAGELLAQIEGLLAPWGFARQPVMGEIWGDKTYPFELSSPVLRITILATLNPRPEGVSTGFKWSVTNRLVQRLASFLDKDADERPSATGSLSERVDLPSFIGTPQQQQAWAETLARELPALVRDLHSIRRLDALANTGPRRSPIGGLAISFFTFDTGHAPFVLAYLAGSPRLEEMLREIDEHPSPDTRASMLSLHEYLQANARPLA